MHAFASRRLAAFAEVSTALANGELQPFRSGSSRILAVNPVQMALSGLWGSFFSRAPHKGLFKRFWSRITLVAGQPMPADTGRLVLQEQVTRLRGDVR